MMTLIRRLLPGASNAPADELRVVGDDHPKDAFFTRPLSVTNLQATVEEHATADEPDRVRVSFVATVKDADGKRCPEMAVYARVAGPEREATGMGHTSLLGKVTFRMSGPAGTYTCTISDVAGGALGLDLETSTMTTTIDTEASSAA